MTGHDLAAVLDELDPVEAGLWRQARLLLEVMTVAELESIAAGVSVDVGDGLPSAASIVLDRFGANVQIRVLEARGPRSLRLPRELLAELKLPEDARFLPPSDATTRTAGPEAEPAVQSRPGTNEGLPCRE